MNLTEQSQGMAKLKRVPAGRDLSVAALGLLLTITPAFAQSKEKVTRQTAAPAASSADAGLQARVQTLEEQLVDLQVVVGTLETLAKNGGSAPAPFPASGAGGDGDAARIEGLETQIRALTAQVQQLSDQVRSLGGTPRRSEIAPSSETALADHGAYPQTQVSSSGTPGFGSTTVSTGNDAIGGLLNGSEAHSETPASPGQQGVAPSSAPVATAALAPASETSNDPKQLYETAYGYLLQRDYGAAETAFNEFLKKFPNDALSGNAQYWLGETHFVRGQYKAAASDFLKGYQTYSQSPKAPDSLLKLAMSLDRLGQKDAACSSFAELASKFPTAPQSVKARAQSERQRVGCQ
jgi:tol-pal system protein YbgF